MSIESCQNCGEPVVEGRLNCIKFGVVYPDIGERSLTWDSTVDSDEDDAQSSDQR